MADMQYLIVSHLNTKALKRFFKNIAFNTTTGCWIWCASVTHGYASTCFNGRKESVHRIMYAWLVEPLPRGHNQHLPQLDHFYCDNTRCVNPAHLKLVLPKANILRGSSLSAIHAAQTHCRTGHPLPLTSTVRISRGRIKHERICTICRAAYNERRRESQRLKQRVRRAAQKALRQSPHPEEIDQNAPL